VIVSIPTRAVTDLPQTLFAEVDDSVVVVDTCNYHPELRDGRIDAIERGMLESEWVAQQLGRPVIKAFNNIFARSLLENGLPAGTAGRIALSVAGDPPPARTTVLQLVDDLGFDPVDAGGLNDSWQQQPGTPAYCQDLGAAALQRALAEADRSRIADYRAGEEARIGRSLMCASALQETARARRRFRHLRRIQGAEAGRCALGPGASRR
jgi:predicted dinucleotide-binding enzyme